jgi:hypothetical protein
MEKKMSDDIFLINDKDETQRTASQIFKSSVGLTKKDGELVVVFSTTENRKGYGKQYIPVSELEQVLAVLQNAVKNGIEEENEILTTSETVKRSLVQNDDGEIRFKTEQTKGKKPTLIPNQEQFSDFVDTLSQYTPKILSKVQSLKNK